MTPYYDHAGIKIYHGDCREILMDLDPVDVVITDPVWPNADPQLFGSENPFLMLQQAAQNFARLSKRCAIQLGCDSDPRILTAVSPDIPFFRVFNLEYVRPNYKGRILYTGDVAYLFGTPPVSKPGRRVIPGRHLQNDGSRNRNGHPCPRQLAHVKALVRWWADGIVLDPFCGSGTTLEAAKLAGLPGIGIEIEEEYCEIAAKRLSQEVFDFSAGAPKD